MIIITWSIESTHRSPFGGDRIEVGTGELRIDGFFSQTFDYGLDISTAPIEKSQDITDHARPILKTHQFQCFISDDPYEPSLMEDDHVANVIGGLDYLIANAIPIDVETDKAILEGFLISHRSGSRDETTGDGAEFSLDIQEVSFAELETVDAPAPSVERARPAADEGASSTSATGSEETVSTNPANRTSSLRDLGRAHQQSGGFSGYIDSTVALFTGYGQGA